MSNYTILLIENLPATFDLTLNLNTNQRSQKINIKDGVCHHGRGEVNGRRIRVSDAVSSIRDVFSLGKDEVQEMMAIDAVNTGSDEVVSHIISALDVLPHERREKVEERIFELARNDCGMFFGVSNQLRELAFSVDAGVDAVNEIKEQVERISMGQVEITSTIVAGQNETWNKMRNKFQQGKAVTREVGDAVLHRLDQLEEKLQGYLEIH